jgi:hypothetical protein
MDSAILAPLYETASAESRSVPGQVGRFKDGALATPSGMRYRVLALDPHARQMSLPVSHKIRDLVMERAVCGAKPASDPSLADDNEVQAQGQ